MPAGDLWGRVRHSPLVAMETQETSRPARGGGFPHRDCPQVPLHQVCVYTLYEGKTLSKKQFSFPKNSHILQHSCQLKILLKFLQRAHFFFRARPVLSEALSNPIISKPCPNLSCPDLLIFCVLIMSSDGSDSVRPLCSATS